MEDLVTSVLRVDQREAPRNWQVRDQIVSLLEYAPSTLWDNSLVFNHHMAKARRNLAAFPPSPEWTTEMRREQLELAENHLEDALYYLKPADEERRESPLNLHVSLAQHATSARVWKRRQAYLTRQRLIGVKASSNT